MVSIRKYSRDELLEVLAAAHIEGITTARALERLLNREPEMDEWMQFNNQVEALAGWIQMNRNVRGIGQVVIEMGEDGKARCRKCKKQDYPLSNHRCAGPRALPLKEAKEEIPIFCDEGKKDQNLHYHDYGTWNLCPDCRRLHEAAEKAL